MRCIQRSQGSGSERNYFLAKAFEKLPDSFKPDPSQVMHMRWVLTWKVNSETHEKKPEARAVILGYMDPQYERNGDQHIALQ